MDDQRELEINGVVMEDDQQLWMKVMAQYFLIQNDLHHLHLSWFLRSTLLLKEITLASL